MRVLRVVVLLLVAGCGRTITAPPLECRTVVFTNAAGDTMPPVTFCQRL